MFNTIISCTFTKNYVELKTPLKMKINNIPLSPEEAEKVISEFKSTKEGMHRMQLLDAFLDSMIKYKDKISLTGEVCPKCGKPVYRFWFRSPDCDWEENSNCGEEGFWSICIECPKVLRKEISKTL